MWHHSHCETNTLSPSGLSWRSCGVATFPLPLWASQSSRDPSGQRGSSAWELEPGQICSQQEEPQIRHMTTTTTHGHKHAHRASLAFWEQRYPKWGPCVCRCICVCWQRGVWRSVWRSVWRWGYVLVLWEPEEWVNISRTRTYTHTAGLAISPTEPDDSQDHNVCTVSGTLSQSFSYFISRLQTYELPLAHIWSVFTIQLCTKRPPTQSPHLIHIFPFIHTSGLFEYVWRHINSGTVLPILTLSLFSSNVTDNAQYWWRHLQPSLHCPTQGPRGCSCYSASLHPLIWKLHFNIYSDNKCVSFHLPFLTGINF